MQPSGRQDKDREEREKKWRRLGRADGRGLEAVKTDGQGGLGRITTLWAQLKVWSI